MTSDEEDLHLEAERSCYVDDVRTALSPANIKKWAWRCRESTLKVGDLVPDCSVYPVFKEGEVPASVSLLSTINPDRPTVLNFGSFS